MKICALTFIAVAFSSILITAGTHIGIPPAKQVAKFERYDLDSGREWQQVTKSDGEIVLGCLHNVESFKSWGSTIPSNIVAQPMRTSLGFRMTTISGKTNLLYFSSGGELLNFPATGLLVIPELNRERLSDIFSNWQKIDQTRIASQPLPCEYRIGSANDGGTLSGIARLFYGDATKWQAIYEVNKSLVRDPNRIYAGTVITIPKLKEGSNKSGAANGNQPLRSETNSTSSAAGSRR